MLREDNSAMEMGVHRKLSRATEEAMNFQGNTIDLDNVSNTEELGLVLLLVLMTVKPNGMNLNVLSSTYILWKTSAANKDGNTYGTHTELHNQQLALCPLSDSKMNISQLFTEVAYFLVCTSFTRHKRC